MADASDGNGNTSSSRLVHARVLIAEDEALVVLSLSDLLYAEGYHVVVAADGIQALTIAQRLGDALTVLLTDLNMPHMNGEDLIRTLRADRPGLPVVVVTGSPPHGGAAELQAYAGGNGPLALLTKPIDYPALIQAVAHAAAVLQK